MLLITLMLTMALCATLGVTRSLKPNVASVSHIVPQVLAASTTLTTNGIDLVGFDSAEAVVNTGAIVGAGDFSAKLQESDTNASDFTDVAAADMDVDIAPTATLAASSVYRLGYKGSKRYIGVLITKNGGTSIAVGVVINKGHPHEAPV